MSSYGQGSLSFSPRSIPGASPVPPFPINSADNGLSVDAITGRIVLGNDIGGGLADLLSDREIEMAGFLLQLLSAGTRQLYIDPTTGEYFIGDIDGAGNGATWIVNDANNTIAGFNTAGNALILNMQGRVYDLGDIDGVGNNAFMQIDDLNQYLQFRIGIDNFLNVDKFNDVYTLGDLNGSATYFYNDAVGFEISSGSRPSVGESGYVYQFGDYGATQNDTSLRIDDNVQLAEFLFGVDAYLQLDKANESYVLGDAQNFAYTLGTFSTGTFNGTYMNAEWTPNNSTGALGMDIGGATNQPNIYNTISIGGVGSRTILDLDKFEVVHSTAQLLALDWSLNRYTFGDFQISAPLQNGNYLQIDDTLNLFKVTNTLSNAGFEINGVAGFTGTVSPVNSITVDGGIVTSVS